MASQSVKKFPIAKYLQGTEMLSYDELGVYIRLLEYMWASHGKIPNNDEKIAYFLRIKTKKWQNYKKILQDFFVFSKTNLSHLIIKAEQEKLTRRSKQNALNAKKRWNNKSNKLKEKASSNETKSMQIA